MIYSLAKTVAKSQIAAYGGEGEEGIELGITCPPDRVPRPRQEDCVPLHSLLNSQEILYCTDRIDIYFPARGINYAQEWMQVRAANNHLPAVLAAYSLH